MSLPSRDIKKLEEFSWYINEKGELVISDLAVTEDFELEFNEIDFGDEENERS